jgi:probable F420-dependent oxidoreductase
MQQRPFRFGVLSERIVDAPQLRDLARRVEALGYSTLVFADNIGAGYAPVPAMVVAADATTRLRVGSYVFDNDFRHPVLLAKEAATVDLLTGGRLELGLGAGWFQPEYEQAGIRFDPAAVRIQRMEEALRCIKGWFSGPPTSFEGRYFAIRGLRGVPGPVRQTAPPILLGGGGRRVLSIAAREADIVALGPRGSDSGGDVDYRTLTVEATVRKLAWVRDAAGSRFDRLELNTFPMLAPVTVTDDALRVARELAQRIHRQQPGLELAEREVLASPHCFIGTIEQMASKLRQQRHELGLSYVVVRERDLETFGRVVERTAST